MALTAKHLEKKLSQVWCITVQRTMWPDKTLVLKNDTIFLYIHKYSIFILKQPIHLRPPLSGKSLLTYNLFVSTVVLPLFKTFRNCMRIFSLMFILYLFYENMCLKIQILPNENLSPSQPLSWFPSSLP